MDKVLLDSTHPCSSPGNGDQSLATHLEITLTTSIRSIPRIRVLPRLINFKFVSQAAGLYKLKIIHIS